MTENNYNQSQTQFIVDEPVMEQPVPPVVPPVDPTQVKKPTKKWLIPAVAGVSVLLVLFLLIALRRSQDMSPPEEEIPTPAVLEELSPLEQRLEDIKLQLRAANPTIQELPFPPIDMKLRIDDAR